MLLNPKRVVCFFAHTDDEMLCAGTLHRLVKQGAEVHVVAFGPAATEQDREGGRLAEEITDAEFKASCKLIGATPVPLVGFRPSKRLADFGQRICDCMFLYLEQHKPDVVFTLSPRDENTAHAVVGTQAERVMRGRVPTVIRVHCPWNYDAGHCNLYVRLDEDDLACKRAVINAYQSQRFRYDYETLLMAAVVADGLSVKVPAAERFELVRSVL